MTTGIRLYHRCPFCRPGHGDMAVDTERIIDWLLKSQHLSDDISTDHDVHPAAHTVVFNPDYPRGSACDHLVAASYNPTLFAAANPKGPPIAETTIDFDHAWFPSQGPEMRYKYFNFLFDEYGSDSMNDPRFGSLRKSRTDEWMAVNERDKQVLLLRVNGFARYAERPDVFFRELPRDYAELANEGVSA